MSARTGARRWRWSRRRAISPPRPPSLRLHLVHPTRGGLDRQAELLRGPDGTYTGRFDSVPPGRWRVSVEGGDWRLPAVEVDGELRAVRLGAAEPRP